MKPKKSRIKSRDNKYISAKPAFYDKRKLWLEAIPLAIFLLMIVGAIMVYPKIPNSIPTHWNAAGEADAFGGKNSVFIVPIIFLLVLIMFFVFPLMEVFRENMLKIYNYYYAFKIMFSIFFVVLFIATLLPPLGYDVNVSYIVIAMIGLLFLALGFILPKLKRNFMFGIRTGWTLSSDKVWDKTHKIGGILFAALGIITITLLFILKLEILFFVFLILTILVSIFLVFYSYYIYKKENNNLRTKK
ncbi:MAG: SdpI family protein [Candidatus Woesearchaeota archaeon]